MLNDRINLKYVAINEDSFKVEPNGEILIDLAKRSDGFFPKHATKRQKKKDEVKSEEETSRIELCSLDKKKFF